VTPEPDAWQKTHRLADVVVIGKVCQQALDFSDETTSARSARVCRVGAYGQARPACQLYDQGHAVGLAERQVRLMERQGGLFAQGVRLIVERVSLSREQAALVPATVEAAVLEQTGRNLLHIGAASRQDSGSACRTVRMSYLARTVGWFRSYVV